MKGVKAVLAELKAFMKKKMSPCKCMIERLITKSPINCKHNPYYAGSFNGNDCIWLVENASFIFDSLEDKFTTDKQLKDITTRFCEIWFLWQSILPAIRAARNLSPKEIEQLESDVKSFCEVYVKNTKGRITIKIHPLAAHLMEQISLYGTIGVFCEDSLESIHAIVKLVAIIYAMNPAKECAGLVFKTLHAQKQGKCSVNVDIKMEK